MVKMWYSQKTVTFGRKSQSKCIWRHRAKTTASLWGNRESLTTSRGLRWLELGHLGRPTYTSGPVSQHLQPHSAWDVNPGSADELKTKKWVSNDRNTIRDYQDIIRENKETNLNPRYKHRCFTGHFCDHFNKMWVIWFTLKCLKYFLEIGILDCGKFN